MSIVSVNILKGIYEKPSICDLLVNLNNSIASNGKEQKVQFDLEIGHDIINIQQVQRIYYESKKLRGKTNTFGKVAKHEFLILKDMYRGGRGKQIHESEYEAYKNHQLFEEIQVDAAWSGIIVWRRIGLEYVGKDTEINLIRNFLIPYLLEIKGLSDVDFNTAMTEVHQKGLKEADISIMKCRMDIRIIKLLFPTIIRSIVEHYEVFYGVDSGVVEFNLSDYIRFQSLAYPQYKDYQTVAMYRKVA